MRVTIKDIARETGLSYTAVSLVLNDKPNKLSAESRQRIVETAKRLDYRPNQLAVGLVTRQTRTLGLIIPDISNQYFSTLALGVDEEARKHNRNIIFCNTNDKVENDLESVRVLASRGADAIILAVSSKVNSHTSDLYRTIIEQSSIPLILIGYRHPSFKCSAVMLNNRAGAYNAVTHLIGLGHKDIAFITGPEEPDKPSERLQCVQEACHDMGVPFREECVFFSDFTQQGGYDAAAEALKQKVSAIFCFNDMMALGTLQLLRQKELVVPKDISLVGFDDIPFAALLDVPLTTVKQPTYEIGREAARLAIAEIEKPARPKKNVLFEPELVIRNSTQAFNNTET